MSQLGGVRADEGPGSRRGWNIGAISVSGLVLGASRAVQMSLTDGVRHTTLGAEIQSQSAQHAAWKGRRTKRACDDCLREEFRPFGDNAEAASDNSETTANATRRTPLVENVGQLDLTASSEYDFHARPTLSAKIL
ncbi:hypothetical protein DHEL01_v206910 [Diaporthe helianthi]|uniref:Uncharacterized protein n=1 Tax=Diaporthe helianthi TaxID=158607 RepID=A0A2P5HWR2_DIAHE|nr:hypothetical protein DHEL01_v206910 [Diaporthe helianthi]